MASMISGGGIDVDLIVSQLIHAERAPARALERQRSELAQSQAALGRFESRLRDLQNAVDPLRSSDALEARTVNVSDASALSATAAAGTQPGTYQISVQSLASTHSLASAGFASLDQVIPEGSFDLTVGGETVAIGVGPGTTLESLRDQITASGIDVQSVVVFDGTDYRLSLTSGQSGAGGTITADNFSSPALSQALTLSETSAARDAQFTVNGLAVTRSSNTVSDVVEGLTFNLLNDGGGQTQVTVAPDPEAAIDSIRQFVDAYNAINSLMREQLATAGVSAGPLASISGVRRIQDSLASIISGSVDGLQSEATSLGRAGIEMQNDGSLVIDEARLSEILAAGEADELFGLSGRTTDSRARLVGTGDTAEAGTYGIVVTQAGQQASVTGTKKIKAGGLKQDETLTFTNGSVSVDVALQKNMDIGTVIDTVNSALAGTGIDVIASNNGNNKLQLTSGSYGSSALVDVVSDTNKNGSTGIGTAGLTDTGVDVAGTIGGLAAQGAGRTLLATSGPADGVSLEAIIDPSQVNPGGTSLGDLVVSVGIGEKLARFADAELTSTSGSLASVRSGIDQRDQLLRDRIGELDRRLADREVFLTRKLAQADMALRQMNTLLAQTQSQLSL